MPGFLEFISRIGQAQLLRIQISGLLRSGCQINANLLYRTLDTFNMSLVNDIYNKKKGTSHFTSHFNDDDNDNVYELSALLEMCGMDDSLLKVNLYLYVYMYTCIRICMYIRMCIESSSGKEVFVCIYCI
jgi:hypothetical protein